MGKWSGKYVIGLTGNIGTGKSVVRRMLEHFGAYGIDADALSHRTIAKGAPGYQSVIDLFGKYVLNGNEEIDRARLGRVVFNDPEAMAALEAIIHPLVKTGVDWLVRHASQPVIVIEAIKLLESTMSENCDSIWVTYAPAETQLSRLVNNRKMPEDEARKRIAAQAPQDQKLAAAKVIIRNDTTFEETWRQVTVAWKKSVPVAKEETRGLGTQPLKKTTRGEMNVQRGRPRDSEAIAGLINRATNPVTPVLRGDVMAAFGEKAFLMLRHGTELTGVLGWQVENLVARTVDIILAPGVRAAEVLPAMIEEMERASKNLQCEASLVFAPEDLADEDFWKKLGYDKRQPKSLSVTAWQEAAGESSKPGDVMFFKQLRVDRVLRPI